MVYGKDNAPCRRPRFRKSESDEKNRLWGRKVNQRCSGGEGQKNRDNPPRGGGGGTTPPIAEGGGLFFAKKMTAYHRGYVGEERGGARAGSHTG